MKKNIFIKDVIDEDIKVLSGRLQGEGARETLKIEEKDFLGFEYNVIIPKKIRTFNPSYFLGLFCLSIGNMGIEKFRKKYVFISENNEKIKQTIENDIEEGIEWALDELDILH